MPAEVQIQALNTHLCYKKTKQLRQMVDFASCSLKLALKKKFKTE